MILAALMCRLQGAVGSPLFLALLELSQGTSLVVRPMHLGERPPPVRAARHILLRHSDSPGLPRVVRSRDDTLAFARDLVARARAGAATFEDLAAEHSQDPDGARGAVLGTFVSGSLAPELDRFLFASAEGEISDPLEASSAVHVLQRIDSHAAVLQILVRGGGEESRTRAAAVAAELAEGADFPRAARERSDDEASASRGGQFAIFERGPHDLLLKGAAFRLRLGEVCGPLQSPLGWHLLKRVPLAEVDPSLAEPTFVRLRGILVRADEPSSTGASDVLARARAREGAQRLHERLRAGEDMRKVARESDEDPGGREREGDLGWIHRNQPGLRPELKRACLLQVGEMAEVQATPVGFVILRREK